MQRYATLEKRVGETPLEVLERYRAAQGFPEDLPLAYAGRLDPMASGKLLILIGEECKRQKEYHGLDKEYAFSILFGLRSDTGDVLGIIEACGQKSVAEEELRSISRALLGTIELPYPHFSSKTVHGKPLHIWTLEGRLGEIEIPKKRSRIHRLTCTGLETMQGETVSTAALAKIATVTKVTEVSKRLGRDFRRSEVRASWKMFAREHGKETFQIAHFRCIVSSGTYMRSLAEHMAKKLGTRGLAFSIERSRIGRYLSFSRNAGLWIRRF